MSKINLAGPVETWEIDRPQPYPQNTRIHDKAQIKALKKLIKKNGFIGNIVVDKDGVIVSGHGRWQAMKELGAKSIPVQIVSHLTEDEVRAMRIADNMVARGEHDQDILAAEIRLLGGLDNFDFDLLAMDGAEVSAFLDMVSEEALEELEGASIDGERQGGERDPQGGEKPAPVERDVLRQVAITCKSQEEQEAIYDEMTARGFKCQSLAF